MSTTTPAAQHPSRDLARTALATAVAGIPLDDSERRALDWLGDAEPRAVVAVASIIRKAAEAAAVATSTSKRRPRSVEPAEDAPPPMYDCRARRHKVLAADGICVVCGARGVADARTLPPPAPALVDVDTTAHPTGERP